MSNGTRPNAHEIASKHKHHMAARHEKHDAEVEGAWERFVGTVGELDDRRHDG